MKKILFISTELPHPAESGGKVKTAKLVRSLADFYQVTFASPLKLDNTQHQAAFAAVSGCEHHLHAPVDVPRNARNLLASYLKGHPLNVMRTFDEGLRKRISDVADDHDIILLDHYEVFPYLPRDYKGMVVYHAHNAYFKIWERYADHSDNPVMGLVARLEARRVRRYEAEVAKSASIIFAAPNDAEELIAAGVAADRIHHTYHLGDDTQLGLPDLRYEDTEKKLMYVGFLGWEPNVQGLLWFIEKVWPTLLSRHPELRFDIVGKNPDERLQLAAKPHAGIKLTGFVDDLQSIYQDSRVSVAPLLFGSGMKVKVMDALARGIPIVTTTVGAESIEAESGRQLMIADDPSLMADHIDKLLENPVLWRQLQVNSRALVRERYTWQRLFDSMHRAIEGGKSIPKHS
ncbi:MAG: glycosyltransferase [Hyphomicrobiaceae bacterium]